MSGSKAQGGSKLRNRSFPDLKGSLGCVVQLSSDPSQRFVLSASHVMNPGGFGRRGDAIEAWINGNWQKIAELEDWSPLRDRTGTPHACDAAIARITAPALVSASVQGIGVPTGSAGWAFQGRRLRVCGAVSGLVDDAVVYESGQHVPVFYDDWAMAGTYSLSFDDQILYGPGTGPQRTALQSGDSGSLVLDENGMAVGLHIARTDDAHAISASVCTPIATVLRELGVELVVSDPAQPSAMAPLGLASAASAPAASAPVPAPGTGAAEAPAAAARALPLVDEDRLSDRSRDAFGVSVMRLLEPHTLRGGAVWQLTPDGLVVDGRLDRTRGRLVTVPRVWRDFGDAIQAAASEFQVPVELIVATLCTESGGDVNVPSRRESRGRMSVGVMQTLIGTAREALPGEEINEHTLRSPATSIRAGTAYIRQQRGHTGFDPPLVACAYNAGGLYPENSEINRWRLRQYPIGTAAHADRFVQWFNDCFAAFASRAAEPPAAAPSLWRLFWG